MILPIDCELGWNCWIANYVDHERSEDTKDYACGAQTYNKHKGTDFMIRNYRDMIGGVIVRAAADGMVVGARDGMKDVDFRTLKPEQIAKKECGNGVRIDHGDGWVTQYCHLRKNSVKVKKAETVKAGDVIGFVGNSGKSMYPHLHFQVEYAPDMSNKKKRHIVDPFVGVARKDSCSASDNALWPSHILEDLRYQEVSIIDQGFASAQPRHTGLIKGVYDDETLSVRSPRLFLWARFLHVKKGDMVTFEIKGPDGEEVLSYTNEVEKDQAYRHFHAGVGRPAISWDGGVYRGFIKLVRQDGNGGRIFRTETSVSMR